MQGAEINQGSGERRVFLTQPGDWHVHLRDGAMLARVVPDLARRFARAIVMPNLNPPVTTTTQALAYRQRITSHVPAGLRLDPLMTLYLTDSTPPEEIADAKASARVHGVKWYPAGATTNSESGVADIRHCDAVLAAMEAPDLPLLGHREETDPSVDVFDRERWTVPKRIGVGRDAVVPLRADKPVAWRLTGSQAGPAAGKAMPPS